MVTKDNIVVEVGDYPGVGRSEMVVRRPEGSVIFSTWLGPGERSNHCVFICNGVEVIVGFRRPVA